MIKLDIAKKIAVTSVDSSCLNRAEALAIELGLSLVDIIDQVHPFLLVVTPTQLELRQTDSSGLGPLSIDFLQGELGYRFKQIAGRKELIARAVGWKNNQVLEILDVTAGLGRDGFLLARLGCRVTLIERSPIIAALLSDALQRAAAELPDLKLKLITAEAKQYLLSENSYPDVIYLDPMYPHRTKSALVKKEMRYLRYLVGEDEDAPELLDLALKKAKIRVVVKRPRLAPTLNNIKPDTAIIGKNTRFDIYFVSSIKKT